MPATNNATANAIAVTSSATTTTDNRQIKMVKPKRPLSAYNLFYRFKRTKILEAYKAGDDSTEAITRLVAALPGLEEHDPALVETLTQEQINELSRTEIRAALVENLSPKDTRNRTHRKSHGALTFLEMNKIMVGSWKSIDDVTRSAFEELAEEGRRMYHKRVAAYEEKYPAEAAPHKKKIKKTNGPSPLVKAVKKVKATGGPRPLVVASSMSKKPAAVVKPPAAAIIAKSPSPTPFDMSKWMGSVVTPPQPHPFKFHDVHRTSADNPYANVNTDEIFVSPKAPNQRSIIAPIRNHIHHAPPPFVVSPVSVGQHPILKTVSSFDSLDLDLESDPEPSSESLPPFFDIFDDFDGPTYSSHNTSSTNSNHRGGNPFNMCMGMGCTEPPPRSACVMGDFPNLPLFSPIHHQYYGNEPNKNKYVGEASADDFMQLIATLDESLAQGLAA